jgi:heat shock protein HslJ
VTTHTAPPSLPRRWRLRLATTALIAASVVISACGSSNDSTTVTADQLEGRSYVLISATGVEIVAGSSITLDFEPGSLAGSAGCNRMFGGFEIDEGRLLTNGLATTKMACEPALMDQEGWFLDLLSNAPTIAVDNDQLLLGSGDIELVFDRT